MYFRVCVRVCIFWLFGGCPLPQKRPKKELIREKEGFNVPLLPPPFATLKIEISPMGKGQSDKKTIKSAWVATSYYLGIPVGGR